MNELTSSQRKLLSAAAQNIKPVVQIGQNGLTDGVTAKVEQSLAAHELIKIKFIDFKEEKKELAGQLCVSCNAVLVRIIGNIAVLYRPAENKEDRSYGIVFD
jgi:RNA-binding protein